MALIDRRSLLSGCAAAVTARILTPCIASAQAPAGPFTLDPLPYPANTIRAAHRRQDDGDPSRPASRGLRDQPERGPRRPPRTLGQAPIDEISAAT